MAGSNLPSSFASAAAGQNPGRDRNSTRGDSRGNAGGDWLRRDGRSNGTAILRRSSTTPFNNQATTSSAANNAPAAIDTSPSASSVHDLSAVAVPSPFTPSADSVMNKYSREELLELGKAGAADCHQMDISNLMMDHFNPGGHVNGHNNNHSRGWGKTNDANTHNDPTACWDTNGGWGPLGLQDMSADEKELFASDVNSPLKQQQQQNQQNKEGGAQGPALNGRKQSMSQGLVSPSGGPRPATRRRETTDTNPFSSGGGGLISPTSAGPNRFDSSWFGRKSIEHKDADAPPDEEKQHPAPQDSATRPAGFAGLTRSSTAGAAGFASPSAWGTGTVATTPTATTGFGFGNFALTTPGVSDKGFGSSSTTGGSRFFSKRDSSEIPGSGSGQATGTTAGTTAGTNPSSSWRNRPRTDTDPFGGDESGLSGSAALGGARDTSPPPMPTTHGSQIFDTPAKGSTSDFGMSNLNLGSAREGNASSASPSQTNPYRSPPGERGDNEHDDLGFDRGHHLGGQSEQNSNFGSIRGFPSAAAAAAFDGSDRSQTSSVGAKNYPPLSNIGGWPSAFPTATPDRERSGIGGAFGSVFSPMSNEVQSPGLGGMGGGLFGPASTGLGGSGSLRGASRLGSLFPPAMQAQMQSQEHDPLSDSIPDVRQPNPMGVIGGGAIGPRDTESPMPVGARSLMDIFPGSQSQVNSPGLFTTAEHNQTLLATASQGHGFGPGAPGPSPFGTEQPASGPPQSQTRIMVMPDRMRWMYMDPQGLQQGPFTGLEMNEWYKANFFTNDLRVRKLEDPEFEPLGQLIRRIGNSREPFLVPQVGVPHGPPQQSGHFSPGGDTRAVVPPLLGVVPSYGKTLTAEEQNNLERRKQEEQLAAARHREMLAQQAHPHFRNMHPAGPGAALHHQASMHSLQSQPSFGSITSPIAMPPQHQPIGPTIGGPTAGFFDQAVTAGKGPGAVPSSMNTGSGSDQIRADLSDPERQLLANLQGPSGVSGMFPHQPVGASSAAADPKSQLPSVDQLERDSEGFKDRLKEFQEYQGIHTQQQLADDEAQSDPSPIGLSQRHADTAAAVIRSDAPAQAFKEEELAQQNNQQETSPKPGQQQQTLTQQVQKAQADAAHAAHRKAQEEEAWAHQSASTGLPLPFPPPPPSSTTPLPAPTAQRRSNIPEQYIDTRSQNHTPDSAATGSATATQPPPLAPWARDPGTESHKGPSLKEIQEAEAKRAAKLEAQRRAQQEQEALVAKEREKANPVVPGLPANSTWGSGSPAPVSSSPWAKPTAIKTGVPSVAVGPTTPGKKTLAEIQREEEARKVRQAKDQAAQTGAAVGVSSMGKRYADLASKSGPPGLATAAAAAAAVNAASSTAGGWATVGAGGKVKVPTGPAAAQPRPSSASTARTPAAAAAAAVAKPFVKPATAPANKVNTATVANAELQKYVKEKLSKGLSASSTVDNFAHMLFEMPLDDDLIKSMLREIGAYDSGSKIDPNHFTEDFIRRKKQADKGIFEPAPVSDPKGGAGGSGWSEVAKKGGSSQPKESDIVGAGFSVVPRKKGKK